MDNDNTTKSNRWKVPALINLVLIIMCAMTFGANALIARADISDDASFESFDSVEKWYEVEDDGSQLSVFLQNRVNGYVWKYGASNDKLRQLHQSEINEDGLDEDRKEAWRLYLVPRDGEEGEVELTFVCVRDIESYSVDTRTLKVSIDDGKIKVIEE